MEKLVFCVENLLISMCIDIRINQRRLILGFCTSALRRERGGDSDRQLHYCPVWVCPDRVRQGLRGAFERFCQHDDSGARACTASLLWQSSLHEMSLQRPGCNCPLSTSSFTREFGVNFLVWPCVMAGAKRRPIQLVENLRKRFFPEVFSTFVMSASNNVYLA